MYVYASIGMRRLHPFLVLRGRKLPNSPNVGPFGLRPPWSLAAFPGQDFRAQPQPHIECQRRRETHNPVIHPDPSDPQRLRHGHGQHGG